MFYVRTAVIPTWFILAYLQAIILAPNVVHPSMNQSVNLTTSLSK